MTGGIWDILLPINCPDDYAATVINGELVIEPIDKLCQAGVIIRG